MFLFIAAHTHVHPHTEMCMTNETIEYFIKRSIREDEVELIDNIIDGKN